MIGRVGLEAYTPPSRKTPTSSSFRTEEMLSCHRYGKGSARSATSVTIFGIEVPRNHFRWSTPQKPVTVWSQTDWIGMH